MSFLTLSTPANNHHTRLIAYWLVLCLLIMASVMISFSVVRLSESGHSLIAFKPDITFYYPADDAALSKTFSEYQQIPGFTKSFPDISLEDFRHMFLLEYIHSLLQWVMRALFVLPFLWILYRKHHYSRKLLATLCFIFILALGQQITSILYMESNLVDNVHKGVYALLLERGMLLLLFCVILWQVLSITHPGASMMGSPLPLPPLYLQLLGCVAVIMIMMQIFGGICMSALHAGLYFNTFPLMDGQWIPDGVLPFPVGFSSLMEDIPTVQFFHRLLAYGLGAYLLMFWALGRNNPHVAHLLLILFCMYVVEFLFGVLSLLFVVPVPLEALHEANALTLLAVAITTAHRLIIPLTTIAFDMDARPLAL